MEILFLLVGLLFAVLGFYIVWDHIRFLGSSQTVTGRVTALERRTTPAKGSKNRGGPIYYPVIEYTADGRSREFTSKYGMSMPQYEIGTSLPVIYSRKRGKARIRQKLPFVVGGIFTAMGIGLSVLFFNIFTFSGFSVAVAAVVVLSLYNSARKLLKKMDISTLDELRESFRNSDMKTYRGTEPEEAHRIQSMQEVEQELFNSSRPLRWIAPVFTLVGLAMVILGLYLGKQRALFLEEALTGDGTVISLNRESSDDGYVYYPVVRFIPPGSSNPVTFRHDMGSNPPSYSEGETVAVLYRPGDPADAIIDGGIWNWFGPGIALLLGLIFSSAGVSMLVHWRRLLKSQKRLGRG